MILFDIFRRILVCFFRRLSLLAENRLFILHTATAAVVLCPKSGKTRLLFFFYIAHLFSYTAHIGNSKSFIKGSWEKILSRFKPSVGEEKILDIEPFSNNVWFTATVADSDDGDMDNSNAEKSNSDDEIMHVEESRTNAEEEHLECHRMEETIECSIDDVSQMPCDSSSQLKTLQKRKAELRAENVAKRQRSVDGVQSDEFTLKNVYGNSKHESIAKTSGSAGERVELSTDDAGLPDKIMQKAELPDLAMDQAAKSRINKNSEESETANDNDANASTQSGRTTSDIDQFATLFNKIAGSDDRTPPDTKPPVAIVPARLRRRKYNPGRHSPDISEGSPINLRRTTEFDFQSIAHETNRFISAADINSDAAFLQLQQGNLASTTQQQLSDEFVPSGSAGREDGNKLPIKENAVNSTTDDEHHSDETLIEILRDAARRINEHLEKKSERQRKYSGLPENGEISINFEDLSSGPDAQPTTASKSTAEVFSNGKTFQEMLGEFEADNHESGGYSGNYYPKFRKYPGLAEEPRKVKKDARFQKRFYKQKPVLLPTDWGKDDESAVTRQPEPRGCQLDTGQMDGDEIPVVDVYPPNCSKDYNGSLPSPVKHKTGRKLFYEDENVANFALTWTKFSPSLIPGYKEHFFEDEFLTDSNLNLESSKEINRRLLDDAAEFLPPVQEISQLSDRKSASRSMSTSGVWMPPTEDETSMFSGENSMQKPSTSKHVEEDAGKLNFACIKLNYPEILDEKALFCRDILYTPPPTNSTNSPVPLKSYIRIDHFKKKGLQRDMCVEDFLDLLLSLQKEYIQWFYTADSQLFSFTLNIPVFKIPMKNSCSTLDDDYELVGDTLVRAHRAGRNDITPAQKTRASNMNAQQATAERSRSSSDIVSTLSNDEMKYVVVVGANAVGKGSSKMELDCESNRVSEVSAENSCEMSPQEKKASSSKLQESARSEMIPGTENKESSEASDSSSRNVTPPHERDNLAKTVWHVPSASSDDVAENSVSSVCREMCKEQEINGENVCRTDVLEHFITQERNLSDCNKTARDPKN